MKEKRKREEGSTDQAWNQFKGANFGRFQSNRKSPISIKALCIHLAFRVFWQIFKSTEIFRYSNGIRVCRRRQQISNSKDGEWEWSLFLPRTVRKFLLRPRRRRKSHPSFPESKSSFSTFPKTCWQLLQQHQRPRLQLCQGSTKQ